MLAGGVLARVRARDRDRDRVRARVRARARAGLGAGYLEGAIAQRVAPLHNLQVDDVA